MKSLDVGNCYLLQLTLLILVYVIDKTLNDDFIKNI